MTLYVVGKLFQIFRCYIHLYIKLIIQIPISQVRLNALLILSSENAITKSENMTVDLHLLRCLITFGYLGFSALPF